MNKFGLDTKGFKRARYADIVENMNERAKELFGEKINLSATSPLGIIIKITAFALGGVWQLAENIYYSAFKDTAEGVSLDNITRIGGIARLQSKAATGKVTIYGKSGIIIGKDTLIRRSDGVTFKTTESGVITEGKVDLNVVCIIKGEIGNSKPNTLTYFVNAIIDVSTVTNTVSITGGRDVESDIEFKKRYDIAVSRGGGSSSGSIQASISELEGVSSALVRENDTMETVNGIPPKSISPLVMGGFDLDIAEAIFKTKAGGIKSQGNIKVSVLDSLGTSHEIGFSRPNYIPINIMIRLITNCNFPSNGNALVSNYITDYINKLGLNEDVIFTKVISAIQQVDGIIDIDVLIINSVSRNVKISGDSIATMGSITFTDDVGGCGYA